MKKAAPRAFFAEHRGGCLVSQVERRLRKEPRYGLGFLKDLGCSLVGDSKNERVHAHARRLLLTPGENRRTGSVRNRERIAEILFSISQSVERQEMKRAVRHDNEVLPLEKWAQRREEFAIERFQVALRCTQQGLRPEEDGLAALPGKNRPGLPAWRFPAHAPGARAESATALFRAIGLFPGGSRAFGGISLPDAVVQARCGGSTS